MALRRSCLTAIQRAGTIFVLATSSTGFAQSATANCVRATAGVRGADPEMQLSIFASECTAPCKGFVKIASAAPSQKERIFVTECCPAEAQKLLSLPVDERWLKLASACGVPVSQEALASMPWAFFGKVNQWLQNTAVSGDPVEKAAIADIVTTTHKPMAGMWLPLASRWKGHYTLPPAGPHSVSGSSTITYVLVDRDGRLFAGHWPRVVFDTKGYDAPKFPEREVTLDELVSVLDSFHPVHLYEKDPKKIAQILASEPASPALLVDAATPAGRIADIVRALGGRELYFAIGQDGYAETHSVVLKKHVPQDDAPPISRDPAKVGVLGALRPPKREVVSMNGTAADLAKRLDAILGRDARTALVD